MLSAILATSCKVHHMASLFDNSNDTLKLPGVNVDNKKPVYQGSKQKFVDLINTELHLTPDFKTRSISGTAILTLKPHGYPRDSVTLDAKGFKVTNISELKGTISSSLKYTNDFSQLHIAFGTKRTPGDIIKIQIDYTARPYVRLDSGIIKSREKLGLTFINADKKDSIMPTQFWSQGETEYNSAWFPTIESTDQKMTQEIFLTVDTEYTTLSNGTLEGKTINKNGTATWHWKLDKPHAPYLTMIAGGKWKITHDLWRGKVPVDYYLEPKYAPYAHLVFGNTPEMIEYFSKVLKYDYAWTKYSQVPVRQYTSGAMENTTATVMYDPLLHDARAHLDNTYEDVISHELFHHWFGDLVTCESWDYLAMNESFATFGEFIWRGHKYGKDEMDLRIQEALAAYLREAAYNLEPIINHFYKDPEELFDRHRYEKGGLVLEMLRVYLGDEVFYNGLSQYLHERAFKTTELAYLRMTMEDVSGEDLKWFFNQWFEQKGHPDLEISHEYDSKTKTLKLLVRQLQSNSEVPLFRIPVDVDIYSNTGISRKRIILLHKTDTFYFAMDQAPLLVNFDAKKYLLCHKAEGKSKSEWLYQYYHCPQYLDKYEALNSLALVQHDLKKDTLIALMRNALNDHFWAIRKTAIELFFGKADNYQGEFREKIKQLALHDPKSQVRVLAFQAIQSIEKMQGEEIYRKGLNDSSYAVIGTCLNALFNELPDKDSLEKIKIASDFENYNNSPEVLNVLTSLYGKYSGAEKIPFFHKTLYMLSGKFMSGYLGSYKKLLLRSNAKTIGNELVFIGKINNRLSTFWETISFKNMLGDLSSGLDKNSIPDGGLAKEQVQKLSEQIKKISENINLKNYGY